MPPASGALASPETTARDTRASGEPSRLPGLDGLRALAIVAVLVFHLDARWLPGGFLGVDVFFVVSGFLITTLLAREYGTSGTIDLGGFWTRRARRLVPALALCVPVSILLARLAQGDLLVGVGRQVVGAATFTSNWLEIAAGSDYFASTTPTLFMNLWSLAVEEQFYLMWPIAAIVLLAVVPRPSVRAGVALGVATASALLMALLLDPEAPTRVYYGTDTHVMGLMLGAALAFLWTSPARAGTTTPLWDRHRRTSIAAALATLAVLMVTVDERSPLTFRGGILLASLATCVVVLGVVERPGRLQRLLELPAVRWTGRRSYGIYLWHWPIVLVVGQTLPYEPGGAPYLLTRVLCVLLTLGIADLSFRFLEMPVRRLGFRGAFAALAGRLRGMGVRNARLLWASCLVAVVALATVLVTAPERTSTEVLISANEAVLAAGDATASSPDATTAASPTAATRAAARPASRRAGDWSMPTGAQIDIFGDSMVVGSLGALKYYFPGVRIDAKSNRRWSLAPSLVQARGSTLRRAVVLGFGTNAGTDPAAITTVLDRLGPDRMVVIVTVHGPFARAEKDNVALRDLVKDRDNVAIAEWDAALAGTSGMVQSDGIHPSIRGAHLYSKVIRQALADLSERHTGQKVTLEDLPMP